MRTIRGSSVPSAVHCIHSLDAPTVNIETVNPMCENGTYVHAMLAAHISGQSIPDAPNKDTEILFNCGRKMWRELSQYFPDPMVEQEIDAIFGELRLTGHADVISIIEHDGQIEVRVLDWKSGRVESDYMDQLLAYALIVASYFKASKVTVMVGWLRPMEYDTKTFVGLELETAKERLLRDLSDPSPYRTGKHCGWCRMRYECLALQQMMATATLTLTGHPDIDLRKIQGERLGNLLAQTKLMEGTTAAIKDAARHEVQAAGPLDVGDGRMLTLRPEKRREIDAQMAIRALRGIYGEDVDKYASITAGAIDRLAMDNADGTKKAAREEINIKLKESGAITMKTIYKLVEVKKEIDDERD